MLWDRIIGFDSLELLPMLACSIFIYRARWLLQASEPAHVQRLLSDSAGIKVVPLLQVGTPAPHTCPPPTCAPPTSTQSPPMASRTHAASC